MSRYFARLAGRSSLAPLRPAPAPRAAAVEATTVPLEQESRVEVYAPAVAPARDGPAAPPQAAAEDAALLAPAHSRDASAIDEAAPVAPRAAVRAEPAGSVSGQSRAPQVGEHRASVRTTPGASTPAATRPEAAAVPVIGVDPMATPPDATAATRPSARAFTAPAQPEIPGRVQRAHESAELAFVNETGRDIMPEPGRAPSITSVAVVPRPTSVREERASGRLSDANVSTRDVEVRIGTVAVEFRAPPPPAPLVRAPAAAPAPSASPPRFSPSRHYLRWG